MYGPASQASPGLPTNGARLVTRPDVPRRRPLEGRRSCCGATRLYVGQAPRWIDSQTATPSRAPSTTASAQCTTHAAMPSGAALPVAGQRVQVRVAAELDVAHLGHRHGRRVQAAADHRQPSRRAADDAGADRERAHRRQLAVHDSGDDQRRCGGRRRQQLTEAAQPGRRRRAPGGPARRPAPSRPRPGCAAARRPAAAPAARRSRSSPISAATRSAPCTTAASTSASRSPSVMRNDPPSAATRRRRRGGVRAARSVSSGTSAPASAAEARAPRSADSAATRSADRRSTRCPRRSSTAARARSTASATPGSAAMCAAGRALGRTGRRHGSCWGSRCPTLGRPAGDGGGGRTLRSAP